MFGSLRNLRRLSLLAVLLFAMMLVWPLGIYWLHRQGELSESRLLERQTEGQRIAWRSIVRSHHRSMEAYYRAFILQPETIAILRQLYRFDGSMIEERLDSVHLELRRQMQPLYSELRTRHVRQLHFHTRDSRSLLRMHALDQYGDSLVDARPTVVAANLTLQPQQGFESGRVVSGFRNVFAIVDRGGRHFGSVELSQPFESLRLELEHLDPMRSYMLIHSRNSIEPKLFADKQHLYDLSPFGEEWLIEKSDEWAFPELRRGLHPTAMAVVALAATNPEILKSFSKNRAFTKTILHNDNYHYLTAVPVLDFSGNYSAWLLSVTEAREFEVLRRITNYQIITFTLLFFLFFGLIFLLWQREKRIEEDRHALLVSEERLRLALEASRDGVWDWDLQSGKISWSSACYAMLGYESEAFMLTSTIWREMIHPDDRSLVDEQLDLALESGEDLQLEYRLATSFGSYRWVLSRARIFRSEDGLAKAERIVGTNQDISAQRSYEEMLHSFNRELEERVAAEVRRIESLQKEKEIQQALLIQQSKQAELGSMMGAIAHQWKQPLNAIALITQNLPDSYEYGELTREEIDRHVESVMEQVQFMSQTVDDFRSFYKPSRKESLFSPARELASVLNLIRPFFERNNIEIRQNYLQSEAEALFAYGSSGEFKQVLLNIFSNSRDAYLQREISGKRVIDISIVEKSDSDTKGGVILAISDHAGGISPELLPDRIFESFVSTKGEEGTGIGLSLARTIIVQKMQGSIGAENLAGGARFVIELPLSSK